MLRHGVRRSLLALVILLAVGTAVFLIYGGRYLQDEDPLQKSDAIFVLAGTRAERLLEGYELYKAGYAPVMLLSPGRPEPGERILKERGISFPLEVELQRDALIQSGVPSQAVIADTGYADNTAQEAELLRRYVQSRGWKRVIVVTSKFHVRRTSFAFRRELDGTGCAVITRASRYDPADPANWWRTRADFRFAITEWQKLLAYRLGLGR
jgi:uncharacterized SAM-binding protein YcdF (DUF218 family)